MIVIDTGFTGNAYSIRNPRVAAFPLGGTVTPSTEATGFEAVNAADGQTWTYWKPTAVPATWQLDFAASSPVNYLGIAAHNLGTIGATVTVQKFNGAIWTNLMAAHTPSDDSAILFLFATQSLAKIRVKIDTAIPTIGVIMAGAVTEFPQRSRYVGSLPFDEAVTTTFADTVSDGGQVLERFALRRGAPCEMAVANLSEVWCSGTLAPLARHLQSEPAFFADRPADYPKSVVFGRLAEPVAPARARHVASAARDLTMKIAGFAP